MDDTDNEHGLWFQVFASLAHNPKVLHLELLVGEAAITYYIRLCCACVADRKYRFTGAMPAEKIEAVCRWRGESGALRRAFVESELLDPDTFAIHDWPKHSGKLLKKMQEKRDRDRERMAEARASGESGDVAATSRRHRKDTAATSGIKSEYSPSSSKKGGNTSGGSPPASPSDSNTAAPERVYDGHAVMLAAGSRQNLAPTLAPVPSPKEMDGWEAFLHERCPVDTSNFDEAKTKRDRFVGRCLELMLQIAASPKHGQAQSSIPPEKKFTIATPAAFIEHYGEMFAKFPSQIPTPEQERAAQERERAAAERKAEEARDLEQVQIQHAYYKRRLDELVAEEPQPPTESRRRALQARARAEMIAHFNAARAGPASDLTPATASANP